MEIAEQLKRDSDRISKLIIESIVGDETRVPIVDGIIDIDRYSKSSPRIMIVLKEAYDTTEGEVMGNWLYKDLFGDDRIMDVTKSSSPTWHPLIYMCYGIRNNGVDWEDMPWIRDLKELAYLLRDLAIVNLKKLPGNSTSNMADIREHYEFSRDLIVDQINSMQPQVIICGSTFNLVGPDLGITSEVQIHGSCHYYDEGHRLVVNAYHPAQRRVKQRDYVNDIVSVVCKFSQKQVI